MPKGFVYFYAPSSSLCLRRLQAVIGAINVKETARLHVYLKFNASAERERKKLIVANVFSGISD